MLGRLACLLLLVMTVRGADDVAEYSTPDAYVPVPRPGAERSPTWQYSVVEGCELLPALLRRVRLAHALVDRLSSNKQIDRTRQLTRLPRRVFRLARYV